MGLELPSYESFIYFCAQLSITDKHGTRTKLILNAEQRRIAKELSKKSGSHIILKSRQVGTSTLLCAEDLAVAVCNPGIRIALVADTQTKASELLSRIKQFGDCIGVGWESSNTRKLKLPNGSEIQALGAGAGTGGEESRAGRSQSFNLLHLTELPYWLSDAAYPALLASAPKAPIWIETTAKGGSELLESLWKEDNNFNKIFLSVEEHEEYVEAEHLISQEEWQQAQQLGFTSLAHAAWWFRRLKDSGGDFVKHLHDYPVKAEHCFAFSEDLWVKATPAVRKPISSQNKIEIWKNPEKYHRYVAGVDTSGGLGKDASAIAVFDRTTRELVATWVDAEATTSEIAKTCQRLSQIFKIDAFLIETNGIGRATYQEASQLTLPVVDLNTTADSRYTSLLLAKQEIEQGKLHGPARYRDECSSLHKHKGKFRGKKDLMMATGFALNYINSSPYKLKIPVDPSTTYDMSKYLKKANGWLLNG